MNYKYKTANDSLLKPGMKYEIILKVHNSTNIKTNYSKMLSAFTPRDYDKCKIYKLYKKYIYIYLLDDESFIQYASFIRDLLRNNTNVELKKITKRKVTWLPFNYYIQKIKVLFENDTMNLYVKNDNILKLIVNLYSIIDDRNE